MSTGNLICFNMTRHLLSVEGSNWSLVLNSNWYRVFVGSKLECFFLTKRCLSSGTYDQRMTGINPIE